MSSHYPGVRFIAFLLCLLPSLGLLAQTSPSPTATPALSQTVLLTPPPSEGPLEVEIGLQLLEIDTIEDQSETFSFAGILTTRWKDPRFAFDPAVEGVPVKVYQGDYQFNEIATGWYPEVVLLNVVGSMEKNGTVFRLEPDGTSTLTQAVNATAKTKLKLRRYPFDHQQLNAVFAVLGYTDEELVIKSLPMGEIDVKKIHIPQWELQKVNSAIGDPEITSLMGQQAPSTLVVEMDLRRRFMFVVRLVVLPLFLVVALSWSVFWMDRASMGDRMSVSFVALLTVVAYQIMLGDILPQIAYLTIINLFLNISFLIVCATILVNLMVAERDRNGNPEAGNRLDLRCRRLFPIAYISLIALGGLLWFVLY